MRHTLLQPSPLVLLPSSHCSLPSFLPSPQRGSVLHVELQPSPDMLFPSSHCSVKAPLASTSCTWLPQYSQRQSSLQPSPLCAGSSPSSHCSVASRLPSPQTVSSKHTELQPSAFVPLPSSHSS